MCSGTQVLCQQTPQTCEVSSIIATKSTILAPSQFEIKHWKENYLFVKCQEGPKEQVIVTSYYIRLKLRMTTQKRRYNQRSACHHNDTKFDVTTRYPQNHRRMF